MEVARHDSLTDQLLELQALQQERFAAEEEARARAEREARQCARATAQLLSAATDSSHDRSSMQAQPSRHRRNRHRRCFRKEEPQHAQVRDPACSPPVPALRRGFPMKAAKRRRLEAAGWKVGSAQDFLNLTAAISCTHNRDNLPAPTDPSPPTQAKHPSQP